MLLFLVYMVLMVLSWGDLGKRKGIWSWKTVLASVIAFQYLLASFLGSGFMLVWAAIWGFIAWMDWNQVKLRS
ncbi:MAG: hypothetical protein A3J53_01495 [Candidatus Harrisonbacteria bacterium RIFCSPHIGHO2_02_FULL_40_20]|nr:MAG: hypothetical protein A3J53_01495 [Candidatus Harrisonbacteria bacterium RIFCSPHIGHO2_02_FULL_40_20]